MYLNIGTYCIYNINYLYLFYFKNTYTIKILFPMIDAIDLNKCNIYI